MSTNSINRSTVTRPLGNLGTHIEHTRQILFDVDSIVEAVAGALCSENDVDPAALERALDVAHKTLANAINRLDSVNVRRVMDGEESSHG